MLVKPQEVLQCCYMTNYYSWAKLLEVPSCLSTLHVSCDLPDRAVRWEMKPHLSYTAFLPGISEIYDVKVGTSHTRSRVVQLSLPLLESLFGACGTLHGGVYASEIGMVLPRQTVKGVVGLRSTINSCPTSKLLFKTSIILLSWGGGSPCKEEKVTPCVSNFVRLKSAFKAVSNQG